MPPKKHLQVARVCVFENSEFGEHGVVNFKLATCGRRTTQQQHVQESLDLSWIALQANREQTRHAAHNLKVAFSGFGNRVRFETVPRYTKVHRDRQVLRVSDLYCLS